MNERLDTALRYTIFAYAVLCIVVRLYLATCNVNKLPDVFETLTFVTYVHKGCGSTEGFDLMVLAVLVVFRFVLFGKTYKK